MPAICARDLVQPRLVRPVGLLERREARATTTGDQDAEVTATFRSVGVADGSGC